MSAKASKSGQRRDTNRLHRTTQRLEDLLAWALGVLVALSAFLALTAAWAAHDGVAERARVEATDRTQVTARLETDTSPVLGAERSGARRATVRWGGPDGTEHTGVTTLYGPHRAGDTVPVWASTDGRLVSAPVAEGDAMGTAIVSGVMTAGAAGAIMWLIGRGAFAWTARRYGRAWENEWASIEPEWSGRTRGTGERS